MTILRFIHIFSAIFWVGTTLFMVLFLAPTVHSLGPDGGKFMQRLLGGTRFSMTIGLSAWVTVIAGVFLYGPQTDWATDVMFGARLPLTLGAVAGIAATFVGAVMQGMPSARMVALGNEIAGQSGPPKPEQQAEMQRLQAAIGKGSLWTAALMVLAVIGMVW